LETQRKIVDDSFKRYISFVQANIAAQIHRDHELAKETVQLVQQYVRQIEDLRHAQKHGHEQGM
jgi:hypothetical protein